MLEPSLPIFMMDKMEAEKWQLGAAFLPASISYLIGTNLFGPLGHRMGRWLASFIGLSLIGLALIFVSWPFHFFKITNPDFQIGRKKIQALMSLELTQLGCDEPELGVTTSLSE